MEDRGPRHIVVAIETDDRVTCTYVPGSYASGEAREHSDIVGALTPVLGVQVTRRVSSERRGQGDAVPAPSILPAPQHDT